MIIYDNSAWRLHFQIQVRWLSCVWSGFLLLYALIWFISLICDYDLVYGFGLFGLTWWSIMSTSAWFMVLDCLARLGLWVRRLGCVRCCYSAIVRCLWWYHWRWSPKTALLGRFWSLGLYFGRFWSLGCGYDGEGCGCSWS